MNYTASITLTGNDQLSSMLAGASSSLDKFSVKLDMVNFAMSRHTTKFAQYASAINATQALLTTSTGRFVAGAATSTQAMQSMTASLATAASASNAVRTLANNLQVLSGRLQGLQGASTNIRNVANALYTMNRAASSGSSSSSTSGGIFNTSASRSFTESITDSMRALSMFYVRARNIANLFLNGLGISRAAGEAIEFTSALETSRLSLAASFLTFKEYRDAQGNVVEGAKAYSMALAEADHAQDLLRAKVFDTTATFSQLAIGYQKVVAAAGKSSATQEDFAQLTVNMSNMATSWGMSLETISNQFQSTLLGVSRVSSRVGGFLRGMGVSPATLRSWKDQGIIVQELNKLLVEFGKIGGDLQETWRGVMSNLEDAFQNVFGEGFKSTIASAKGAIKGLTAQMIDVAGTRAAGSIQMNPQVLVSVQKLSDTLAGIINTSAQFIPAMVKMTLAVGNAVASSIKFFVDFMAAIAKSVDWILTLVSKIPLIGDAFAVAGSFAINSALQLGIALASVTAAVSLASKAATGLSVIAATLNTLMLATRANVLLMSSVMSTSVLNGDILVARLTSSMAGLGASAAAFGAKFFSALASVLPLASAVGGTLAGGIFLATRAVEDYGNNVLRITNAMADARARTNMELSANKLGISLDPDVSAKLVALGYVKAREALAALSETYKTGTIDMQMYERVVSSLLPRQKQAADANDKQRASMSLLQEQIDREADKTGLLALQWDRANAITKAAADAKKENRDLSLEEVAALNKLYDIKEKNLKADQAAKRGFEFSLPDKGKLKDRLGELTSMMEEAGKVFSRAMGGNEKTTNELGVDEELIQFQGKQKALQDLIKLRNDTARIGHDNTLQEIEDDRQAALSKISLMETEAKRNTYYKEDASERAKTDKQIEDARTRVNNEANIKIQRYSADTAKRAKLDYAAMYADAVTAADGTAVAWEKAFGNMKTAGQITATYLEEQFAATQNFLQDGIFNALTGRFDDIAKSFTRLTDDFAKSWSQAITEVVKNWFSGADEMGNKIPRTSIYDSKGNRVFAPQTTGQIVGGYLGAAANGYATGAGVGSASGAPGFSTGATVGGVVGGVAAQAGLLGSALGPWGAIIGAVVGAIVGVLSAPNTENHLFIGSGGKTYGTATNAITGGKSLADNPISGNIQDIGSSMAAGLAEAFRASGSRGVWSDWVKSVNNVIGDYIRGLQFEIHAGSDEDMKKDLDYLLKGIIPREMLYNLFGVLKAGKGPDVPGISGSGAYNTSNGFATNAPLYQLFSSLGFTAEKIKEIADQIATSDPAVFLTRIKSLLGVVGTATDLLASFSGGKGGALAEIAKRSSTTTADQFDQRATKLIQLLGELSLYTGEEQLKKAEEANAAALQFWEDQLAAIQKIQELARSITDSIGAQISSIADIRAGKTGAWLNQDRYRRLDQIMPLSPFELDNPGLIGSTTDPDKIAKLAAEAQGLISSIMEELTSQLKNLQDQLANVKSMIDDINKSIASQVSTMADARVGKGTDWLNLDRYTRLSEIRRDIGSTTDQDKIRSLTSEAQALVAEIFNTLNSRLAQLKALTEGFAATSEKWSHTWENPEAKGLAGYMQHASEFSDQVAAAAKLSGDEQVKALEKVRATAEDLWAEQEKVYQDQITLLQTIRDNMKEMTASINSQIEDIQSNFSTTAEGKGIEEQLRKYNAIRYAGGTLTEAQQKDYDALTNQHGNIMREEGAQRAGDRLRELMDQLRNAQTPDEVKRLTGEIQNQGNKYFSYFKEDDPRRQQAGDWVTAMLKETQKLAEAAYKAQEAKTLEDIEKLRGVNEQMRQLLGTAAGLTAAALDSTRNEIKALEKYLTSLGILVSDQLTTRMGELSKQITDVKDEMGKLQTYLGRLNDLVNLQLNTAIDTLVTRNHDLAIAMQAVINLFTTLSGGLTGGTGQPPGGGTSGGNTGTGGGTSGGGEGGGGGGEQQNPNGVIGDVIQGFDNITTSVNNTTGVIDNIARSGNALVGVFDALVRQAGGTPPRATDKTSRSSNVAEVVDYLRRNPTVLNTRV